MDDSEHQKKCVQDSDGPIGAARRASPPFSTGSRTVSITASHKLDVLKPEFLQEPSRRLSHPRKVQLDPGRLQQQLFADFLDVGASDASAYTTPDGADRPISPSYRILYTCSNQERARGGLSVTRQRTRTSTEIRRTQNPEERSVTGE